MEVLENVVKTARAIESSVHRWNRMVDASVRAPEWLYFLAKHFGEKQYFVSFYGFVEVRQFFGVQYMIYK